MKSYILINDLGTYHLRNVEFHEDGIRAQFSVISVNPDVNRGWNWPSGFFLWQDVKQLTQIQD